jgi:hypothetical protein
MRSEIFCILSHLVPSHLKKSEPMRARGRERRKPEDRHGLPCGDLRGREEIDVEFAPREISQRAASAFLRGLARVLQKCLRANQPVSKWR